MRETWLHGYNLVPRVSLLTPLSPRSPQRAVRWENLKTRLSWLEGSSLNWVVQVWALAWDIVFNLSFKTFKNKVKQSQVKHLTVHEFSTGIYFQQNTQTAVTNMTVCVLFLLKLKWFKNKSFYNLVFIYFFLFISSFFSSPSLWLINYLAEALVPTYSVCLLYFKYYLIYSAQLAFLLFWVNNLIFVLIYYIVN